MLPKIISSIPGPRSKGLAQKLRRYESRNVTYVSPHFPVFWKRAEKQNVWDVDGNRFLDLISGFGVATLGFTPDWGVHILRKQSSTLYHGMGDVHPTELKTRLCQELSQVTFERWKAGTGKTLLGNSGFEAVEAALKTAFLATGKKNVLAFKGGYHGLGYGAMTVTGRREFSHPFRRQVREIAAFLSYPKQGEKEWRERLRAEVERAVKTNDPGAILVEPMQGRGGEILPPKGFLKELRKLANAHGMLLVLDEILTGFYRTGAFWACETEGVVPDLICTGKALSGGYPISACVGKAAIMDAWEESKGEALHTSTFLGNPLGCALALESLKQMRKKTLENKVALHADVWEKELKALKFPGIREVRGRGLLWGIEFEQGPLWVGKLIEAALRAGLIVLGGGSKGNVLSLCPSVCVDPKEIHWSVRKLEELLSSTAHSS